MSSLALFVVAGIAAVILVSVPTYLANKSTDNRSKAAELITGSLVESFNTSSPDWLAIKRAPLNGSNHSIENGTLKITVEPKFPVYTSHRVKKDYIVDMTKPTLFSVKTKMEKYLLGQDMYSTFYFYSDTDPQAAPLYITLGVNSEQHWRNSYYLPNTPPCDPKPSDDEFFISVSEEIFPNAPDTRIVYPGGYKKPYTEWTTYSFKYDPPANGQAGLITFFVDGKKVETLKGIDSPTVSIDPHTNALAALGTNARVAFVAGVMTDGTEHSYTGNKFGIRGRGCYAARVPSVPSKIVFSQKFKDTNGQQYKKAWMKSYDIVAAKFFELLSLNQDYKMSLYKAESQISPADNDTIKNANPATLPYIYDFFVANDPTLKAKIEAGIWKGIYAGTVDFETAVMMELIPLPETSHIVWRYHPTGTRERISNALTSNTKYFGGFHKVRRWPLSKAYAEGGVPDMVHFGYLTPEDVSRSTIPQYLSSADKSAITAASVPYQGVVLWDEISIIQSP